MSTDALWEIGNTQSVMPLWTPVGNPVFGYFALLPIVSTPTTPTRIKSDAYC